MTIVGSIVNIRATVACGGCGETFQVEMDPARKLPDGWTLFDEAVDDVRGGLSDGCSEQGGYLLCGTCTRLVDHAPLVPPDRSATAEEVAKIMKERLP